MTETRPVGTLRLILWPSLITLAVSAARLLLEIEGKVTNESGGAMHPLGITWLGFVFGAWFGWRLRRAGSRPSVRWMPLWSLLCLMGVMVGVVSTIGSLDPKDQSDAAFAALRQAALVMVAVGVVGAALQFALWRRLAWTLLLYGVIARATVVVIAWQAKVRGLDTHYTRLGPSGMIRSLEDTMVSACTAELGFWVPFTIVSGCLAGSIAASLAGRQRG